MMSLHHVRERVERRFTLSVMSAVMVAILGSFPFFERVESVTYRLTSAMDVPFISNTAALAEHPETIPRVLLISSEMYEQDFQQVSPLDRSKLAEVVSGILDARPALLAADLDVSPTLAFDPGQARLDALLLNAQTHIVLATPSPVENPVLRMEKFRWMQKLCAGGVRFGVPTLHAVDGMVLRYPTDRSGFSQAAAAFLDGGAASRQASSREQARLAGKATPCEKIAEGSVGRADFLDPANFGKGGGQGPALKGMKFINANYFDAALDAQVSTFSSVAEIPGAKELAGRVVFLGGQYGIDDRLETLDGERYGAVIHAAIFYSLTHPLAETPAWMRKLVDVLLGAVLMTVFQWLWNTFYHNQLLYESLKGAETFDERARRAYAFGRSVMSFSGVLGASGLILWLLLLASTAALKHGSQFSIAFMAFAMLLYCIKWNRKGAARAEFRQGLITLRARFADPVHAGESPVELLDRFLDGDHHGPRQHHARGFLAETASHLSIFFARRWHDLRFIFFALRSRPLAALWATGEFLTYLIPIAVVAWALAESVFS